VVLGFQHAMRLRHIIICGLPGFTKFYDIISYTARFSKKVIEYKMCVLVPLQLLFETFLTLRRSERDMIKNVYWSSCEVPVRYSYPMLIFPYRFSKNTLIWNFTKILPVIAALLHEDRLTDGQTSMTKLIVAFRNFFESALQVSTNKIPQHSS
jgi:hypothetical protein